MALGLFMLCCFTILLVFQPKEHMNLQFCLLSGGMILISILLILVPALFFSKMMRHKKLLKKRVEGNKFTDSMD